MAQPNVVREPSMDEILASIRRIIESNEPVMQSGIATMMAEPEGFSGDPANDDSEDVPLTVDETFAEHDYEETMMAELANLSVPMQEMPYEKASLPAEEPQPVQAQKSLSLADVAARVRAASERNPGLRELAPKPVEVAEKPATNPLMTDRMTRNGTVRVEPVMRAEAAIQDEPVMQAEPAWNAPENEEHFEFDAEVVQPEPVAQEPAAPLISAGAGQQVARSFQDLALAVDQAERRSFDEIAADMLRPMLQEWLDDNLPTLVERLVREEIERVARGSRR